MSTSQRTHMPLSVRSHADERSLLVNLGDSIESAKN